MSNLEKEIFGGSSDEEDLNDLKMEEFDSDQEPTVQASKEQEDEEYQERVLPSFKKKTTVEEGDAGKMQVFALQKFCHFVISNPGKSCTNVDRKKVKPKKKKHQIQPLEEEDVKREERELSPESAKRQQARNDFDNALAKIKTKGRKRDLQDEAELDEKMIAMLEAMKDAAFNDQADIKEKKPAYSKMKMLPVLEESLAKRHWHTQFLENNILDGIKLWLEPLPDSSLPNIKLQKVLLQALDNMPIETHHLRHSGVGRIVMFYTKSPRIMPDIQALANKLLDKWMRPILRRSASYKDTSQVEVELIRDAYSDRTGARPIIFSNNDSKSNDYTGSATAAPVMSMVAERRSSEGNRSRSLTPQLNEKFKKMQARMRTMK